VSFTARDERQRDAPAIPGPEGLARQTAIGVVGRLDLGMTKVCAARLAAGRLPGQRSRKKIVNRLLKDSAGLTDNLQGA